jgi:hypothetical protein
MASRIALPGSTSSVESRVFLAQSAIVLEEIDFGCGRGSTNLACKVPSVRIEDFRIADDIVESGLVLQSLQSIGGRRGYDHVASAAFEPAFDWRIGAAFLSDQQNSHSRFVVGMKVAYAGIFNLLLDERRPDGTYQLVGAYVVLKIPHALDRLIE